MRIMHIMQAQIQHITTYNGIIGAVLRSRREQIGLEQSQIAQRLGLTQSSYSRIESGKTSLTLIQLADIAPKIGLNPQDFIAQVESIKLNMQHQGIDVSRDKDPILGKGVTNILIGAALLAVVTQMIRK